MTSPDMSVSTIELTDELRAFETLKEQNRKE